MSLFKTAYARGAVDALIAAKVIKVANEDVADMLAGAGAEGMESDPLDGPIPEEESADLSANLVELAEALSVSAEVATEAAGSAAGMEGGAVPGVEGLPSAEVPAVEGADEAAPKMARLQKNATILAAVLKKLAADTPAQADPNTIAAAAMLADEMADEAKEQPAGHANMGVDGVGNTAQNAEVGSIGHEEPKPAPNAMPGSNTATEMTAKAAASMAKLQKNASILAAFLRKLAADTPAQADPNTIAAAAIIADEMADEAKEMPAGHANMGVEGVGDTTQNAEAGSIGHEEPKPAPNALPGSNTATEMTAKAASDSQYDQMFRGMVDTYGPYLPPRLSVNEKVAALQYMMGLPPTSRDQVAQFMAKTAELPPGLAEAVAMSNGEEEEDDGEGKGKDKDKDKDKEDKGEKEAGANGRSALLGSLRNLHRSA